MSRRDRPEHLENSMSALTETRPIGIQEESSVEGQQQGLLGKKETRSTPLGEGGGVVYAPLCLYDNSGKLRVNCYTKASL